MNKKYKVQTDKFDNIFKNFKTIDFCKIDVQGEDLNGRRVALLPRLGEDARARTRATRCLLAVVPAIGAMHRGEVTHFIALGGNFLSAAPDTEYTAEALRRCELTVHISTKLNRSHLVTGREAYDGTVSWAFFVPSRFVLMAIFLAIFFQLQ